MSDDLLEVLEDSQVLLQAYAASAPHVLRRALEGTKALQGFRHRADLARDIVGRMMALGTRGDPVKIAVHLYALELTGATREARAALARVLAEPRHREDPVLGQFAGLMGVRLLGRVGPQGPYPRLSPEEVEKVASELAREVEER
ncbi:MAG: hypothetical protein K6U08_08205 [Firmicutes bacterium]|nr:hypothetical protein [Bacillota bacterium]